MEYLFRGISKSDKKWIYGDLVHVDGDTYIFNDSPYEGGMDSPERYEVMTETVCQFTGLFDKNGVKIFDGDIVMNPHRSVFKVVYSDSNGRFKLITINGIYNSYFGNYGMNDGLYHEYAEVIGNIHDNPELINK